MSLALGIGIPASIPLMAAATCVHFAVSSSVYVTHPLSLGKNPSLITQAAGTALKAIGYLSTIWFSALAVLHTVSLFEAALPYTITTLAPWTLALIIATVATRALFVGVINRNAGREDAPNFNLTTLKGMAVLGFAAFVFSELN